MDGEASRAESARQPGSFSPETGGGADGGGGGGESATYGLLLEGPAVAAAVQRRLIAGADVTGLPRIRVDVGERSEGPAERHIGADRAEVPLLRGGWLEADREAGRVVLHEGEVDPHVLAHPGLAWIAVVWGHWLDRVVLHGGTVLGDEGAWVIAGVKTAGKSTLVGHLAARGLSVLTDDTTVIDDGVVHRGPRVVDLRQETAERWSGPELEHVPDATGVRGDRWRVLLDPVPPSAPLRGIVLLGMGDELSVERVRPTERLGYLARHLTLYDPPPDRRRFLALADTELVLLRRPADWDRFEESVDRVVDVVGA